MAKARARKRRGPSNMGQWRSVKRATRKAPKNVADALFGVFARKGRKRKK